MHPLVDLARKALEKFILERKIIEIPAEFDEEFRIVKAGVFVCLKVKNQLRGCIGTFMPTRVNIAEETIRNSIAAGTADPRFPAVIERELRKIMYTVDVLSAPEPVGNPAELDPAKYGIIVVSGSRKGLLLPDLDGVRTVDEQISIAKLKANIMPEEDASIFRFGVDRYK